MGFIPLVRMRTRLPRNARTGTGGVQGPFRDHSPRCRSADADPGCPCTSCSEAAGTAARLRNNMSATWTLMLGLHWCPADAGARITRQFAFDEPVGLPLVGAIPL